MTTNVLAKIVRRALWIAPVVIIPVVLLASLPWLKQHNVAIVPWISAAAAIFVMGYSIFLAARVTRRLDEVQIAGQRFAHTNGMTVGSFAAVLVMIFPPAMNALVDLANTIGAGAPHKAPVILGIFIGFALVVIFQALGMVVIYVWWERRLGGPA
jgi:hypothetical protein